ncbi:TolB family protein [Xanthovirga aplysinae]|uniref:TolB family protein n=1 Tax=Xanthovirga aplysinae TaxID=2529853 RepID=UPI0012BCE3B1|nr:DUF5050 domain-containing protein [Xanthovirga aplysinae]MTI30543.1 DUF5050 domain-containing protein [Xanthovirga aplysinae]
MKTTKLLILTIVISLNTVIAQENIKNASSLSHLEGPYLGQKPPGLMPEPFAPGIVTTEHWEYGGGFSPDLKEFYFIREVEENKEQEFVVFQYKNNRWQESVISPRVGQPFISPDGKIMHLGRRYKERTETGDWSEIKKLGSSFQEIEIMRLTASSKGTWVFDEVGMPDGDGVIRYSRLKDGKREEPGAFGKEINTGKMNAHPFIAPDESYLIWDGRRESGYGSSDIYISFRRENGSWGEAINLGDKINTDAWEAGASVTPDGKYLFFNRNMTPGNYENVDIFWVDAQIIETLRPKSKSLSYTIAYSSKESGDGEIYLTNSNGKSKFKLTNREGNDGYTAWSPDGKQMAMYAYHDGGDTWSIHTMNIDGTNRKRLTHTKNVWDSSPTWSPDGRKIAFARAYTNTEGIWMEEIWIMNADGSEQTQIKPLKGGGPFFTPDGKLLYHANMLSYEICIADIDGSNIVKLTNNEARELHPEISPDGKQIAFMSERDGSLQIYVMNADGSNQKRLTFNVPEAWGPSWSPDGSKLIYSAYEDGKNNIYMMKKDGSSVRKIISNGSQASWLKVQNKEGLGKIK